MEIVARSWPHLSPALRAAILAIAYSTTQPATP